MKRTSTSGKDEVLRWQRKGGGSSRLVIDGMDRIIKPGEVFLAKLEEVPEAFRDTIVPLDKSVVQAIKEKEESVEPAPVEYNLKHRGGAWYDVLDAEGKQVNETALRKAEAEELISSLK